MPNTATHNEIPLSVVGSPDCMLSELSNSESNGYSSEIWGLFLREFTDEQTQKSQPMQDARVNTTPCEINTPPLQELSRGHWQSLGGYFDYSQWAARERFVELDNAIAATPYHQILELQETV
jgi:hypothetical protein